MSHTLIHVKHVTHTHRFVKRDDLMDMGFPEVAHQWFADFTPNWKNMWKKGATCFWEGRAYDFRWFTSAQTRWFRFKTKRTMLKGAMCVHICFHRFVLINIMMIPPHYMDVL